MTREAKNSCCSHLKVKYSPLDNLDGTKSSHWECVDCGTPFAVFNLEAKDRVIAEKDALAKGRLEQLHILGKAKVECEKELQAHKDAIKVAIEFIEEVSCVHNTLMEIRARAKAREIKAKINELIGEK